MANFMVEMPLKTFKYTIPYPIIKPPPLPTKLTKYLKYTHIPIFENIFPFWFIIHMYILGK